MNFNCREPISIVSPDSMTEVGATFERHIQRLHTIIKLIQSGEINQDELETVHREGLGLLEEAKQAQTKLMCSGTYYPTNSLHREIKSQFCKWDTSLIEEMEEQLSECCHNQIAKIISCFYENISHRWRWLYRLTLGG